MTNSAEIRQKFLDFFRSKGHSIVASAPLVVKNDPTLMFTNAGMNQFKDYFLGNKIPDNRRIADTQKCLRVSGKHNDLEDVGYDTYHHTMFEMLGNWSFGDYFKQEAIDWAWELLTKVYDLPVERLYVTVFEGDKKENLDFDQEAFDIWKKHVPEERIIYGNKKDNFWEMGDQGPCGPCSEIHIDLRPQSEIDKIPGKLRVNNDDPQVIEIWNLVFIQFNRKADSSLEPLPDKHVDTGMGFERLVRAIHAKTSNYDTDVFLDTIHFIEKESGKTYGENLQVDIAMRVLSDHIRAISFAVADGQLPSNNKAGYVIRRILRRAVRYYYTFLDVKEPLLHKMVAVLADQFKHVFPELYAQKEFVAKVLLEEENSFLRTLANGLVLIQEIIAKTSGEKIIQGKSVFELYDTFGFPVDLTSLIARENGFSIDEKGFEAEMEQQKSRSRAASAKETGDWITVNPAEKTEFIGYDSLESSSQIVKYRKVTAKNKSQFEIVLDRTPFYAESGGQVGDTGHLLSGNEIIYITDTKKENDLIISYADQLPSDPLLEVRAVVDADKRLLTQNNHSATHLLQSALRQVLGNHVAQKGSYVSDEILRFDFAHFSKMTKEEITQVDQIVNEHIRQAIPLDEKRNVPITEAMKLGATALFGEKYGDFVRVITFDRNYSVELCGGTHVSNTARIGYFKIVSESSVAAGVRRIEALTGKKADEYIQAQDDLLEELKELLKSSKDVKKSIEDVLNEKAILSKKIEEFSHKAVQIAKKELISSSVSRNGATIIIGKVEVDSAEALKTLAFELKNAKEDLFAVLTAVIEDKPQIAVMIGDGVIKEKNLNASNIVRELAKSIQGGGGGQPFFATAGGKNVEGLNEVLVKAKELI